MFGVYSSHGPTGPGRTSGKGAQKTTQNHTYLQGLTPKQMKTQADIFRAEFKSQSPTQQIVGGMSALEALSDDDKIAIDNVLKGLDDESVLVLQNQLIKIDNYQTTRGQDLSTPDTLRSVAKNPSFAKELLVYADQLPPQTFVEALNATGKDQKTVKAALNLLDAEASGKNTIDAEKELLKSPTTNQALKPLTQLATRAAHVEKQLDRLLEHNDALAPAAKNNRAFAMKNVETVLHINDRMSGDFNQADQAKMFGILMKTGGALTKAYDDYLLELESLASPSGEFDRTYSELPDDVHTKNSDDMAQINNIVADNDMGQEVNFVSQLYSELSMRHLLTNTQFFVEDTIGRMAALDLPVENARITPKEKASFPTSGLSYATVPTTLQDGYFAFRISRVNGTSIETHIPIPDHVKTAEGLKALQQDRDWIATVEPQILKAIQQIQSPQSNTIQADHVYRRDDGLALTTNMVLSGGVDITRLPEDTIQKLQAAENEETLTTTLFSKNAGEITQEKVSISFEPFHDQQSDFVKVVSKSESGVERTDYYYISGDKTYESAKAEFLISTSFQQHLLRMQSRLLDGLNVE